LNLEPKRENKKEYLYSFNKDTKLGQYFLYTFKKIWRSTLKMWWFGKDDFWNWHI